MDTLSLMGEIQGSETGRREKSSCDGQAIKHNYKDSKWKDPPLENLLNLLKRCGQHITGNSYWLIRGQNYLLFSAAGINDINFKGQYCFSII